MILIKKNETPGCKRVLQYAVSSKEEYKDISSKDKDIIKESLLMEQGYLCAYCMRRLDNTKHVKIEHIAPQSIYPEKSLVYKNMLAVCDGNEGSPYSLQTCDTHKRDTEIKADPTEPSVTDTIYYNNHGEILSSDSRINDDLNDVLNLNAEGSYLIKSRKDALNTINHELYKQQEKGKSVYSILNQLSKTYGEKPYSSKLQPYVGIMRWYIHKKLERYN